MKLHKNDNGELIQVGMEWKYSRPNPVYKCQKCGTVLKSTQYKQMTEKN